MQILAWQQSHPQAQQQNSAWTSSTTTGKASKTDAVTNKGRCGFCRQRRPDLDHLHYFAWPPSLTIHVDNGIGGSGLFRLFLREASRSVILRAEEVTGTVVGVAMLSTVPSWLDNTGHPQTQRSRIDSRSKRNQHDRNKTLLLASIEFHATLACEHFSLDDLRSKHHTQSPRV